MRRRLGWLKCLAVLGGACVGSSAGSEMLVAERIPDAAPEAAVGTLRCWPQGGSPATRVLRVETPDGRALPHRVIWWREGDPLDLRFDCGRGLCAVVVRIDPALPGTEPSAGMPWEDRAGVVLETRRRVTDAADSWLAVSSHWEQAGAPLGRSEVHQICDGIHRHGPTADFLSHYRGWLRVEQAGRYGFATVSDDASMLLVDGRVVAEWPGWHGVEGGLRGEHHGWLQLAPGLVRIDYYNVQNAAGFTVLAAWCPPGLETFAPMPPERFEPVAPFRITRAAAAVDAPLLRWEPAAHVRSAGGVLLGMAFAALPSPAVEGTEWRWHFPDGVVREGEQVLHAFCREGLLPVTLETLHEGRRTGSATVAVRVKPDWSQRVECDLELAARILALFPDPVLEQLLPGDLAAWVLWADGMGDPALLTRLGGAVRRVLARFDASGAEALHRLGFHWQRPALRRHEEVRAVWGALLGLVAADPGLRGRTALHWGGMELHAFGKVADAGRLFAEAERLGLEGDDRRLLELFRGDAAVLEGRLDSARDAYVRAGTVVRSDDPHYEVRRTERLERARRLLDAGEFDAAERVARELEWERPLERMGLATGLLLAQAQEARGEAEFAAWTLRRLRKVGVGDPLRPALLRFAARCFRACGAAAEAATAEEELLRLYPYSEAAAWVREEAPADAAERAR